MFQFKQHFSIWNVITVFFLRNVTLLKLSCRLVCQCVKRDSRGCAARAIFLLYSARWLSMLIFPLLLTHWPHLLSFQRCKVDIEYEFVVIRSAVNFKKKSKDWWWEGPGEAYMMKVTSNWWMSPPTRGCKTRSARKVTYKLSSSVLLKC